MRPLNRRADRVALLDDRTHEDGVAPAKARGRRGLYPRWVPGRLCKPLRAQLRGRYRGRCWPSSVLLEHRRETRIGRRAPDTAETEALRERYHEGTDGRHSWPITPDEYDFLDDYVRETRWPVPPRGRPAPGAPERPRGRVKPTPPDLPRVIPAKQGKADRWALLRGLGWV